MRTIVERHIDLRHGAQAVNDPAGIQGVTVPKGAILRAIVPGKDGTHGARLFFEVDSAMRQEQPCFVEVFRPEHRGEHAREAEVLSEPPEGVQRRYLGHVVIAGDLLDTYFLYQCIHP
jgi:hypothetical protein